MHPHRTGQTKRTMAGVRLAIAGSLVVFATSTTIAADDAALLGRARDVFQALPKDMSAPGLPMAKERVQLGRLLFFDPRMTIDGNVSCATCHQPGLYGTDALAKSIGVKQRQHPRNAPSVLNAALNFVNHWRGDRKSVEDQAEQALTAPISSGLSDERAVVDRLQRIPSYARLFKAAFPDDRGPVSTKNTALAIGAYERTLVTPSPFDDYLGGNTNALPAAARAGLGKLIDLGCAACHRGIGVGGDMYRKFGLVEDYWTVTGSQSIDKGRADVTKDPADLYVFRVPSLRNVAMTPPYFHDGSVATLPDAVKIMGRLQLGLSLSDADTNDIVAFLESLTGELPAEFAAAPGLPPAAVAAPK
jgi:cytochrome c peroxidase